MSGVLRRTRWLGDDLASRSLFSLKGHDALVQVTKIFVTGGMEAIKEKIAGDILRGVSEPTVL